MPGAAMTTTKIPTTKKSEQVALGRAEPTLELEHQGRPTLRTREHSVGMRTAVRQAGDLLDVQNFRVLGLAEKSLNLSVSSGSLPNSHTVTTSAKPFAPRTRFTSHMQRFSQ